MGIFAARRGRKTEEFYITRPIRSVVFENSQGILVKRNYQEEFLKVWEHMTNLRTSPLQLSQIKEWIDRGT